MVAPARSAYRWTIVHLAMQFYRVRRRPLLRVRYEDLVREPDRVLAEIAKFAELDVAPSAPVDVSHTVSGNPLRFGARVPEIHEDTQWEREFGGLQRLLVTSLTWPLLLAFRYPLLGRTASPMDGRRLEGHP